MIENKKGAVQPTPLETKTNSILPSNHSPVKIALNTVARRKRKERPIRQSMAKLVESVYTSLRKIAPL
jgi:hypothetical protein